jgi:hypothetical protein
MGYVNRTINNILRKTTLVIKTTDVGGDADQSHTAKNLKLSVYIFVQFLSSYNKFVTCAIFSKKRKKVFIIPADYYNQTLLITCQHYAHGTLYYNIHV